MALRVAKHVARLAMRIALPEVCAACGVAGTWMCDACLADCRRIDPSTACRRCGKPSAAGSPGCSRCANWLPELVAVCSVFAFAGPIRDAVHRLKYQREFARAEWCAIWLIDDFNRLSWPVDLIVPVPLHAARERERGYNQAEKLARDLSHGVGVPVSNALVRRRFTRPQVGLGAAERVENVNLAFAARGALEGQSVLLIDDVLTTGATLNDCARACSAAGAKLVWGLTLAADV